MNIQFVRLDDRVCETLNRMAREQGRTVSEMVNEILLTHLKALGALPPGKANAG